MASSPEAVSDDSPFVGHIVLDVPAEHPTLGFAQIAEALAAVVQASEPRFAVGIFGGWGSGKSTLMDEIERLITEQQQAIVVKFNAWRYEREPHLIVPLLDTIRASLSDWAARRAPDDPQGSKVRELAGRIGRVVRALVRATSLEIGLSGAVVLKADVGQALDEMSAEPANTEASPQSLYFAAFEELRAAFSQVSSVGPSRIVVFVDDLDRCLPDRALTVLESMKLFFDMPGFVFIVGLDEQAVEAAVRTRFSRQEADTHGPDGRVEGEYLKKIFQVPYTLPAMMPAQLDNLLKWMADYGQLSAVQRADLKSRVRRFLRYVATEGRINPREVKRYVNAYTLHRMIRKDLEPNVTLALQTMDFRRDWERVYEDAVLAEPEIFVETLREFRAGNNHAFEDLWPQIGVLPLELAEFFRSEESLALAQAEGIERYVSLLESTRSSHGWVKDAMRQVGMLRRLLREIRPPMQFGDEAAREKAAHLKSVLGSLANHQETEGLTPLLEKLMRFANELVPLESTEGDHENATPTTPEELEDWRQRAMAEIDILQEELRLIRRASAFGSR
jgi:hypothetical protein